MLEFRRESRESIRELEKVTEQILQGAVTHYERVGRWPQSRDEIQEALRMAGESPDFVHPVESLALSWSEGVPVLDFVILSGSRWKVRVRIE